MPAITAPESTSRRRFLQQSALALGALALPFPLAGSALARTPVRVRGRVTDDAGRGIPGVPVTDGLAFADTDAEGHYALVTTAAQPFVYLTLPAGYAIPRQETGTARLFAPLRPDAKGEAEAAFRLTRQDVQTTHAFIVLADIQTQTGDEMARFHAETVPDVAATVSQLGDTAAFGVAAGDIMFDDLSLYPEYERAVRRMGLPFFQVVGNHDLDFDGLTDEASTQTFRRHFGPSYYAFDRGDVHYVVLDDVFWNHDTYFGYLDAAQLAWLEADLARVEPGRTVVVVEHIPALSTRYRRLGEGSPSARGSISNREGLYRLLEPFEAHLVAGHTHESEHVFEGGVHEHILGTACGAWWSGPICYDGTPSGYAVFEARGGALRWRYRATGREADHQLRVYPRGADPTAPDELVANVWDWDPAWTVVWYEDGERRGEMARRTGLDPLSVALHRGEAVPAHRPWVEPVPTDHLFYAPVSAEARDLRVEVTDRWGQAFSATPTVLPDSVQAGSP